MDNSQKIKNFWNEQAVANANSSLATCPDTILFNKELEQIKIALSEMHGGGQRIIDIGCGNGVKGIEIVKNFEVDYLGIDYAEEMVS